MTDKLTELRSLRRYQNRLFTLSPKHFFKSKISEFGIITNSIPSAVDFILSYHVSSWKGIDVVRKNPYFKPNSGQNFTASRLAVAIQKNNDYHIINKCAIMNISYTTAEKNSLSS